MRLDASACCVTGKVTSARRNVSQCADCGWLVDWPWGGEWAETQHGSLDLRWYPSSQSELGERERELRRTRRAKIGIYQFNSTFSLVFVLLFFFLLRQKCFRCCLGVCSWRCCVRWFPGLQTITVRRLQFLHPNFTEKNLGAASIVLK